MLMASNFNNDQPPYLEVFRDAPLIHLCICSFDDISQSLRTKEWLEWVHSLQLVLERTCTLHDLYMVHPHGQGGSYLLSASPAIAVQEQTEKAFDAARDLFDVFKEIKAPDDGHVEVQVCLHAGDYAGAVIGSSAWSYDLYGNCVNTVVAMNKFNSPGKLLVSKDALRMLKRRGLFVPHGFLKVGLDNTELFMMVTGEDMPDGSTHHHPHEQYDNTLHRRVAAAVWQGFHGRLEADFVALETRTAAKAELLWAALLSIGVAVVMWLLGLAPSTAAEGLSVSLVWTVLSIALLLRYASPQDYTCHRETLWCCQRILSVLGFGLYAYLAMRTRSFCALQIFRIGAITMVVEAFVFQMRFRRNIIVTAISLLLSLTITWHIGFNYALIRPDNAVLRPADGLIVKMLANILPLCWGYVHEVYRRRSFLRQLSL